MRGGLLRETTMSEWQPIETASIRQFDKDNWYIRHSDYLLLWNGGGILIGAYAYTKLGKGKWESNGRICCPTHWMPLPAPPDARDARRIAKLKSPYGEMCRDPSACAGK